MKIKHRVAATAAIVVMAVSLAACSSGGGGATSAPTGKVSGTLTGIFFSGYKSTYEKIVAAFEKKYPHVKVNFDYQGGDIGSLVLTQLQGGTAPDVLTSFPGGDAKDNADSVVPLASQGRILPLTASWSQQIPSVWASSFNYKGKTYAYPGALQSLTAIYNKTELDKLGLKIPTTLNEVYQLCTDAKAKGVYAYGQGFGDTTIPQMLSFAQMASLLYGTDPTWDKKIATGEATYPTSKWVDQLTIYQKMFKLGCFGDGALGRTRDQSWQVAAEGQALGVVDVGAALAPMQQKAPKTDFVIAGIPATNDHKTYVTALPGFVTTINAKAKNPAAAQAFLDFMGTEDASNIYATGFAGVPVIPDPKYKAPAELADFAKLIADKKYAVLTTLQAEVQTTLNTSIQSMMLGNDTPKSITEKMQAVYKK